MFLFLIDDFMARNSCCISPVTTKSVLIWVFLCWGSGVDVLLPSTQLHHGTQASSPLLIVPRKLNISVVGLTFVKLRPVTVWSLPTADFGNMVGWILWWWKVDSWVNCCLYKAEVASVCELWCFALDGKVQMLRWWKVWENGSISSSKE